MRRLLLPLAVALAACGPTPADQGQTPTTTVVRPPTLKTMTAEGGTAVDATYATRRCRHYHYVVGADGRRHRQPCPTPTPPPAPPPSPNPDNPPPGPTYPPASGCGVERWAVKTLTDPGANSVKPGPVDTTIAALDNFAPPIQPTDRVAPVETTTWRIHARLVAFKVEADSDIHVAIADGAGNTMIAEIPNPGCASGSLVLGQITAARAAFVARFGEPTGSYQSLSGTATITGVGFFDRIHGQRGVAPNGIELHPLTAISFP